MTKLIDVCPSCHGELAGNVKFHCEGRPKSCGWIRHACDKRVVAVIDPRQSRYYMEGGRT